MDSSPNSTISLLTVLHSYDRGSSPLWQKNRDCWNCSIYLFNTLVGTLWHLFALAGVPAVELRRLLISPIQKQICSPYYYTTTTYCCTPRCHWILWPGSPFPFGTQTPTQHDPFPGRSSPFSQRFFASLTEKKGMLELPHLFIRPAGWYAIQG